MAAIVFKYLLINNQQVSPFARSGAFRFRAAPILNMLGFSFFD